MRPLDVCPPGALLPGVQRPQRVLPPDLLEAVLDTVDHHQSPSQLCIISDTDTDTDLVQEMLVEVGGVIVVVQPALVALRGHHHSGTEE